MLVTLVMFNVKLKVEISLSITLLIKNGRSFMKMRKNNGPMTLPCGTPNSKTIRSDKQSTTLILRNLSIK